MPSKKITLLLEGLDCDRCANKIEAEVNQINGVVKASVCINQVRSIYRRE